MKYIILFISILFLSTCFIHAQTTAIWQQESGMGSAWGFHILKTSSGYLVSGRIWSSSLERNVGCAIVTDQNGVELFRHVIEEMETIHHSLENSDGFIVVGRAPLESGFSQQEGYLVRLNKVDTKRSPVVRIFPCSGLCRSRYQPGWNALIRTEGDKFLVGGSLIDGTKSAESTPAFIAEYDGKLGWTGYTVESEFNLDLPAWGNNVQDMERSSKGDYLLFGSIEENEPDGCSCVSEVGIEEDIWFVRMNSERNSAISRNLGSSACDRFIDATPTPTNGYAILGESSANNFADMDCPQNEVFSDNRDWLIEYDENNILVNQSKLFIDLGDVIDFDGTSIQYNDGFVITGFQKGPISVLQKLAPNLSQEWWFSRNDVLQSIYYYSTSIDECHIAIGFGLNDWNGNGVEPRKIWDAYGNCDPCPSQICSDFETTLTCSTSTYSGSINEADGNNFNAKCTYLPSTCYSGSLSFDGADEVILIDIGNTPRNFTIELSGLSQDLDLFLFEDCISAEEFNIQGCLDSSLLSGNANEQVSLENATGTYYLIIDASEVGVESNYNLTLNCEGLECENAIPIVCGQDTISNTFSVGNINNNYSICGAGGGYDGPDIVYQITDFALDNPTDIFIGLRELGDGAQAELDVFIIENCNSFDESGNSLASCVDFIERFADSGPALLEIPNANPNSEYFIIVDSKSAEGDFQLSVSCPESCTNDTPLIAFESRPANNSNNGSSKISSYYNPGTNEYFDGYTGEDYKVDFTAPVAGGYTISLRNTNNSTANLDLFVMSECNPFECIAVEQCGALAEEVTVQLLAQQTIYLAVDAVKGVGGDFELTMEICQAEPSRIQNNRSTGANPIIICKENGTPQIIEFSNTSSGNTPYTYFLTSTTDTIISEIPSSYDASGLKSEVYKVYGLSYFANLNFSQGQHISEVKGDTCEILSDNFTNLAINDSPTADAGEDQTICEGSTVQLSGNISNTSNGSWSSSGDGAFDDPSSLSAIYTPSSDDIRNGSVILTLSAIQGDPCPSAEDNMLVTIDAAPIATVGQDRTICEGSDLTIAGDPSNASMIMWSTFGDGSFSTLTNPTTTYSHGNQDLTLGGTSIVMETISAGVCPNDTDTLILNIITNPIATTNVTDTTICQGSAISLIGTGSNCRWLDANNVQIGSSCTINVSPMTSTTFKLEATNTAMGVSCSDEVIVTVTVVDPPEIRLIEDTDICDGGALNLVEEIVSCQNCECLWTPAIGLDDANSCDPIASPNSDQLYTLQTSVNGTCIEEQSIELAIRAQTSINIQNDHLHIRQNYSETLNLLDNDIFVPPIGNPNQISIELKNTAFLPADLGIQDLGLGELIFSAGDHSLGRKTFEYILTDLQCGNQDTGTIEILIFLNDQVSVCNPALEEVGCEILPNIQFNFPKNDIVIWDRSGTVVHLANPYANDWDGTNINSGGRVPSGAYYFVLNLGESPAVEGQSQIIRGAISILWK